MEYSIPFNVVLFKPLMVGLVETHHEQDDIECLHVKDLNVIPNAIHKKKETIQQ